MGIRQFRCLRGHSAQREVLLGFASAKVLHALSFVDQLDEDTGRGYQRRLNAAHSMDFRRYIQRESSTTLPLTFNLRPESAPHWSIHEASEHSCMLEIRSDDRVLSQVDCQHRLGHLADLEVELPFMVFVGLTPSEEMEVFTVINSKAKGLNSSLIDFHDARLSEDLCRDRPEVFVALLLRNNPSSPWYRQLDLGGASTSGLARRASLRTVQKAIKRCLARTGLLRRMSGEDIARAMLEFWIAVATVLPDPWAQPRKHLLTKGVGVYALTELFGDFVSDARDAHYDRRFFASCLADVVGDFDWSTSGPLKGLGGEAGAKEAIALLRSRRARNRMKAVVNG